MGSGHKKSNGADTPAVSFGKLPNLLGYNIRRAQASVFHQFGRITKATGVTPGEFSFLSMVEANPGVNQITLARVYKLDKATLSLAVKNLTKRKLIRSTRSREDGRRLAINLTQLGRHTLRRVERLVDAQERMMDAALKPGERQRVIEILSRITKALT